jgi:hypothetical protein
MKGDISRTALERGSRAQNGDNDVVQGRRRRACLVVRRRQQASALVSHIPLRANSTPGPFRLGARFCLGLASSLCEPSTPATHI